jgi:hypothetical protein
MKAVGNQHRFGQSRYELCERFNTRIQHLRSVLFLPLRPAFSFVVILLQSVKSSSHVSDLAPSNVNRLDTRALALFLVVVLSLSQAFRGSASW